MPSVTVQSLIDDALTEIGVLSKGESADTADSTLALRRLNLILDNWNAEREAVYAELFETFTLVPGNGAPTLGITASGATWVTSQGNRPVDLDGANLILTTSTPSTRLPLNIRDYQWWQNVRVRDLTTSIPTDLYYEPAFPIATVHLWPVPSIAYGIELVSRGTLAQATIGGTFNMPPGYQAAATFTLAEQLATPFGRPVPAETKNQARLARALIFELNETKPKIQTRDAGMPSGASRGTVMNFLDRTIS